MQRQNEKIISIDTLNKNIEALVASTIVIDNNVAIIISQSKDDFYSTYEYLKPNCEKSTWEKIKDSVTDTVEWCLDTWNTVVNTIKVAVNVVGEFIISTICTLLDPLIETFSLAIARIEVELGVLTQAIFSVLAYAAFSLFLFLILRLDQIFCKFPRYLASRRS